MKLIIRGKVSNLDDTGLIFPGIQSKDAHSHYEFEDNSHNIIRYMCIMCGKDLGSSPCRNTPSVEVPYKNNIVIVMCSLLKPEFF